MIRGEKQKTVMALDSRPLAINKWKSNIGDPSLVVQNPVKALCDEKESNQKFFLEGKPMSSGEEQVQSIKIHPKLVENFQTRSPLWFGSKSKGKKVQKSWESRVLRRGLTIVCSEGNKRQVRWGFHKGIEKLVYLAGHSQHIPRWTKEF